MQTFTNFLESESLMPFIKEVATIIAAQEKEPMEYLLDCSKQYPELEVLILDKLNERDRALEEAGFWGGVQGAVNNFMQGAGQRLQQGWQQGSQQAKYQAAIKAVQDLSGLIGNSNMQRIVNYIQQKSAGTWPNKPAQPPVQAQVVQPQAQGQPQAQQQQQQQQQQAGPNPNWSPENQQQWQQRQQQIAAMQKSGRLGT